MSGQPPSKKAKPAGLSSQRDLFGNVVRSHGAAFLSRPAACVPAAGDPPSSRIQQSVEVDDERHQLDASIDDSKKRMRFDQRHPLFEFFQFRMEASKITEYCCTACAPQKWNKFKARVCYEHVGVRADAERAQLVPTEPTRAASAHKANVQKLKRKQELDKSHGMCLLYYRFVPDLIAIPLIAYMDTIS